MQAPDVTALMDDQRQRWQRGDRLPVESYLARHPLLKSTPSDLLDLIYHEVVLREENGETWRIEEYFQRFPDLHQELRLQFEVHLALSGEARRSPAAAPSNRDELPSLPGYEVIERLGRGGFGAVYRARQKSLGREVALKLLHDRHGNDPKAREQLREEAQALARLKHPNVVQIHLVEEYLPTPEEQPVLLLCLEFVEGGSLAQKLDGTSLSATVAAALTETLARAVQYLHERGVVHCDLKPANVLLDPTGQHAAGLGFPKIADFGFARLTGPDADQGSGRVGGTACYVAPEQVAGDVARIGPTTDVWALGVILYELLTGRPPFVGLSGREVRAQVASCEPLPPSRLQPNVPRDLETICLKCLHKAPVNRYSSASELAEDLRRFQAGEPITARPVSRAERLWLLCRRRPAVSLLLLALVLVGSAGVAAFAAKMTEVWHERDNTRRAWQEEQNRREELAEANRELETRPYLTRILLAYRAWLDADLVKVNRILDECPPDLRQIEWYALKRRSRGPRVSIQTGGRPVDLASGKVLDFLPADLRVQVLAWNSDRSRLAVIDRERKLLVWDVAGGKWLWSQPAAELGRHVHALQFVDEDSVVLAVVGDDPASPGGSNTLEFKRWEARTGKPLGTVTTLPMQGRTHVSLSPNGQRLAWMSRYDVAWPAPATPIYDTTTGKVVFWLGERKPIRCVAFSRDGRLIATSGRTVKIWQALTQLVEICDLGETAAGAYAMQFSPDGQTLVTVGQENVVRLWKAGEPAVGVVRFPDNVGTPLGSLGRSEESIVDLGFTSKQLVTLRKDGVLEVWDVPDRGLTAVDTVMDYPAGIAFRTRGEDLRISLGFRVNVDPQARVVRGTSRSIEVNGGRGYRPWIIGGDPEKFLLSQDGRLLAVVWKDGTRIWELDSQKPVSHLPGQHVVAFTADGALLATLRDAESNVLAVVDCASGKERGRLVGPSSVQSTKVSPDGCLAAVAYENRSVLVWDLSTGKSIHSFQMPGDERFGLLALHPDGRHVVLLERTAVVRNSASGQERFRLTGLGSPITCAEYSPDGRRLLTGSEDGNVELWDADTGQELLSFQDRRLPIRWVSFSPDGHRFAAGCGGTMLTPSVNNPAAFLIWDARPLDRPEEK